MILGLSNAKVAGAILVGICISLAFLFVMMPHPVSVPQQVITPVPTPPPVVITSPPFP